MTVAMLRDHWWWPWWVSSLIDLGVATLAVVVFLASKRRGVRFIAAAFVFAALVAAVLAPIVMTNGPDESPPMLP